MQAFRIDYKRSLYLKKFSGCRKFLFRHSIASLPEKKNLFGIPLISTELNKTIFGEEYSRNTSEEKLNEALQHLKSFNLNCDSSLGNGNARFAVHLMI